MRGFFAPLSGIKHPVSGDVFTENVFVVAEKTSLPESWNHVVTGGGDDQDMLFRYGWYELGKAHKIMAGWMSRHLRRVVN
jgi:hypothetical protein